MDRNSLYEVGLIEDQSHQVFEINYYIVRVEYLTNCHSK